MCHTNLHYREGGINDEFPFLLGHEAAGIVEAVGPGVTEVATGDFVVLNWRAVCGQCRACAKGEPQYCFATHNASQPMTLTDGTPLSPPSASGRSPRRRWLLPASASRSISRHPPSPGPTRLWRDGGVRCGRQHQQPDAAARVSRLRDTLVRRTCNKLPDVSVNGHPCSSDRRLPGNANLHLPGREGDYLVMLLDARGVEVSTGSACSAGLPGPSRILLAMGAREAEARCNLRITLGHTTRQAEVDAFVEAIASVAGRARVHPISAGGRVKIPQGVPG